MSKKRKIRSSSNVTSKRVREQKREMPQNVKQNEKLDKIKRIAKIMVILLPLSFVIFYIIYASSKPDSINVTINSESANSIKEITCQTSTMDLLCKEMSISCEGPLEIEFGKAIVNGNTVTCRSMDPTTNRILSDEESETLRIIPDGSVNSEVIKITPALGDSFGFRSDFGLPYMSIMNSNGDDGQYKISINDYNKIGDKPNGILNIECGFRYITGDKPVKLSFCNSSVYFGQQEVKGSVVIYPSVMSVYNTPVDYFFSVSSHSSISPETIKPFQIKIPTNMISGKISLNNVANAFMRSSGTMKYNYFGNLKEIDMNMNELHLNSPNEFSVYCDFDMEEDGKYSFCLDGNASMIKMDSKTINLSFLCWILEYIIRLDAILYTFVPELIIAFIVEWLISKMK